MNQEQKNVTSSDEPEASVPQVHGRFQVLALRGRLDAAAAQAIQKQCSALRLDGVKHVALELSKVTFVSSSGLGVFLALTEEFKEANGSFHLVAPSNTVAAVIKLLNLHRFLSIELSLDHLARS